MEEEKEKQKPKEKRKFLPGANWIQHRWFAHLVGLLFFIGGLLYLAEFSTDNTRSVIFICTVFGFFGILAGIVLELLVDPARYTLQVSSYAVLHVPLTILDHLKNILVVLCLTLALIRLIHVLQQRERGVLRGILLVNLLGQLFFGLLTTQTTLPVHQALPGCDYPLAGPVKIRVENIFYEQFGEPHSEARFSVSNDDGQSWSRFAMIASDAVYCGTEGVYSSAGSLGDESVWVLASRRFDGDA